MKNINAKVEDGVFLELVAVSWLLKAPRSEVIREIIEYFRYQGNLIFEGQERGFQELVVEANQKLAEKNMTVEDLVVKKEKKEETGSPELASMVKEHIRLVESVWRERDEEE